MARRLNATIETGWGRGWLCNGDQPVGAGHLQLHHHDVGLGGEGQRARLVGPLGDVPLEVLPPEQGPPQIRFEIGARA